ncbi:hypothetical protein CALVIDRAFT_47097 [Calocera viscosa TUFC12733]|uniref:Uncharacterized protein n=1 Tax=Calocera viscosa (strain TUFC12733) TaxID=1330018 RepID=A0A167FKR2_CALVF|nr:hypothetical protein CALVIDRAFT_47097 [Calocera viscosa TUFC12733]
MVEPDARASDNYSKLARPRRVHYGKRFTNTSLAVWPPGLSLCAATRARGDGRSVDTLRRRTGGGRGYAQWGCGAWCKSERGAIFVCTISSHPTIPSLGQSRLCSGSCVLGDACPLHRPQRGCQRGMYKRRPLQQLLRPTTTPSSPASPAYPDVVVLRPRHAHALYDSSCTSLSLFPRHGPQAMYMY